GCSHWLQYCTWTGVRCWWLRRLPCRAWEVRRFGTAMSFYLVGRPRAKTVLDSSGTRPHHHTKGPEGRQASRADHTAPEGRAGRGINAGRGGGLPTWRRPRSRPPPTPVSSARGWRPATTAAI